MWKKVCFTLLFDVWDIALAIQAVNQGRTVDFPALYADLLLV